ncbi:MAG TPA: DUF523 and DUF1722 domain-containing protein [bacterium]|nr:DUF523 and DUF1722 domain-containing protein [bacterium]
MASFSWERPLVLFSRCLGFDNCRYNAQIIGFEFGRQLLPYLDHATVCPEMAVGLGVPRDPIRIESDRGKGRRLVQPSTGHDVSADMEKFAEEFLSTLDPEKLDGIILKSRSPSCGIAGVKIYPCTGKCMATGKGPGFFGDAVLRRFPLHAVEDEGRLIDRGLREHFLTRIFLFAEFRRVRAAKKMDSLVAFHSRHKYLFKAYHQAKSALLGKIVANHDRLTVAKVIALYEPAMRETVLKPLRPTALINAYEHIFGYFSDRLSKPEKDHYFDLMAHYRAGRITFNVPAALLKSWALRFNDGYILSQSIFEPYPAELTMIVERSE